MKSLKNLSRNQETLKHSAVFPVKLPAFFIKLTTDVGDIIYEPLNGWDYPIGRRAARS